VTNGLGAPEKNLSTLGDFHDMREALRPLKHARAASRHDPNGRRKACRALLDPQPSGNRHPQH
jgi:hypothetical protein